MKRIASNHLMLGTLVTLLAYAVATAILPGEVLSSASSLFLLIFGSVTSLRYTPQAYQILVNRERNESAPEGDGSHLAVYGVSLLANGSVYVGLYGLLWMAMGQPSTWLATGASGFGRAVMGAGFALLFFSPDVTRKGLRLPAGLWLFAAAAVALILAFAFGIKVGQNSPLFVSTSYTTGVVCPQDRPYWGNINSRGLRIYHPPSSAYRAMVSPERCFKSEGEAQSAGFRAPG